jgi:hypothetical protein
MTGWAAFWLRLMTAETVRFVLALFALGVATYALHGLINKEIVETNREVLILALGIILGLSKDAYSYYFGSTAYSDQSPPKENQS